jgi:predicted 3-demethylubiquinone-9 3-methyltransferase (glyoxalase superfamily)
MCETQAEIDRYWAKLSAGGQEGPCGWLTDRFGLSWQVVPAVLDDMLTDPDPEKVHRVMSAIFGMQKLEIAALERAYAGA